MNIWQKLFGKRTEKPVKEEERFILSIDGGGMRGVIPLAVLQNLERHLYEQGYTGSLAQAFDLIAGTSTGGLISLCLSYRDDASLDNLLDTYMKSGEQIFPSDYTPLKGLKRLLADKYPSYGIEQMLYSWFADKKLGETTVPTMVVSYDLSTGKEVVLRSWEEKDFTVRNAGRATTAAPTYFAPLNTGSQLLADGGVIANNPSEMAYLEAKKLFPNCKKFHILSLSTAAKYHTMQVNQTSGLLSWAEDVVPMYSTAQKRMTDYSMNNNPEVEYTRIDGQMTKDIKMDDITTQSMNELLNFGKLLSTKYDSVLHDFAVKLASK